MSITHEDFQRARRISRAIQEHLEQTGQKGVRSTEIYPLLARKGLIEKDKSNGYKFRQFLHKLRKENLLSLIPQCMCNEKSTGYHEWFFSAVPKKRLEKSPPPSSAPATKTYLPTLPEAEIDELIEKARPAVAKLPKKEETKFTLPELETRELYARAYENWNEREIEILERAYNKFGRIDKVAELLERQPSAVERRLRSLGLLKKDHSYKTIQPKKPNIPKPKNLKELLEIAESRPGMFFSDSRISSFAKWLLGYEMALIVNQVEETHPLANEFKEFHDWASHKAGKSPSNHWHQVLLDECDGDEKKALVLCFEWIREFCDDLESG